MARGYQKLFLVGNVGSDPETRAVNGKTVTSFSFAVNMKQGDGESTQWYKATCWERLAETARDYVTKGKQLLLVGQFSVREWTGTKDGKQHFDLELNVRELQLLGGAGGNGAGGTDGGQSQRSDDPLNDTPF